MSVLHPTSRCDACFEPYPSDSSPQASHAIPCGHIFCKACLHSTEPANCPLCRQPFLPDRAKVSHVDGPESADENRKPKFRLSLPWDESKIQFEWLNSRNQSKPQWFELLRRRMAQLDEHIRILELVLCNHNDVDDVLSQGAMLNAGLHSSARHPLPRCHPNTRKSLRERTLNWGRDIHRDSSMLWVMGSAGAGKSAVARTIAEAFERLGFLGAALFLSRSNHQDDPSRIIATLAHQLRRYAGYAHAIEETLLDDPTLLQRDPRTQFRRLILEPTDIITTQTPQRPPEPEPDVSEHTTGPRVLLKPKSPLVMIIDGLDECQSEETQCEFIELIIRQVRRRRSLLWIICSRPEPHLEGVLRKAEAEGLCWVEELRTDDPDAQSDVERYLHDEFERISRKYTTDPEARGPWIPKHISDKVISASSGYFLFATAVVRYLDQPGPNPRSRLSAVVAAIDGVPLPMGVANPLAYIDNLYLEILGRLDNSIRSTALELLAICAVCPPLPVLHLSQLLEIDLSTILGVLFPLHSIISVPYRDMLVEDPLHYHHTSFTDFLTNPDRSGQFSQGNLHPHRCRLAEACFQVLAGTKTSYAETLTWDLSCFDTANPSNLSVSHSVLTFAATHVWGICAEIHDPELDFVKNNPAIFDYRMLQSVVNAVPRQSFVGFLRWFHSVGLSTFVRTDAHSSLDSQFIERCTEISQPLELSLQYEGTDTEDIPRYALIGFEEETVLVLIIPKHVIVYSMEDIKDL